MKPLHLNLASRPYRDYRPLYAVVVVSSILVAFMMLNNIDTYYRYVRETRTTRDKIAQIESQAATEKRRAETASTSAFAASTSRSSPSRRNSSTRGWPNAPSPGASCSTVSSAFSR